ncbi:AraC family transcriptional regulator [Sansalvadorimonas sp. 2012CJ34-2]|uniref:AraC family transcriptional regulator n=1 Tax=Parendozoicomonas callyspongiae TaxID=2942213 RepID=A0ABT0PE74_9GAMM|nr:AraC family transcriptional regulator [Sansalvadorimonas sp. 2012CJ34-2]MCL6269603.1 AraC family transcriptional regulator [Sansalvadorimonas sp. 2012CJ34-2]
MVKAGKAGYEKRMQKVCGYIARHLDEELTVGRLSEVAAFSRFHFHRQFSGYMGVSVARYIQLLRLKRASYQLAFEADARVIDIALDAGFDYPESFARAFKKEFGQSPSEFRREPRWQAWSQAYSHLQGDRNLDRRQDLDMNVEVVNFPEVRIAVLEHRGAPELVNESAGQFRSWRIETGLSPITSCRTFGLVYDNPECTPPEKFRFDICGEIKQSEPEYSHGIVEKHIPGGRCALVRHTGSHDNIGDPVRYLYGQWLPESGEELRNFPCFFHYLNFFPEVAEHELITDIYLPLK